MNTYSYVGFIIVPFSAFVNPFFLLFYEQNDDKQLTKPYKLYIIAKRIYIMTVLFPLICFGGFLWAKMADNCAIDG